MKWIYFFFCISLFSCNSNHYHDGVYKADVFVDGSLLWVRTEVLEIKGNVVNLKTYSLDSSLLEEVKSTCDQFADRVEIVGKNGIVHIVRFDENGDLKMGEYTYRKSGSLQNKEEETKKEIFEKKKDAEIWQRTRVFEDETGTYKRAVTITGKDIKITLLAGSNNHFNKEGEELSKEYGYISGNKIFIKEGKKYNDQYYWLEDGKLQVNYDFGD